MGNKRTRIEGDKKNKVEDIRELGHEECYGDQGEGEGRERRSRKGEVGGRGVEVRMKA